MVTNKTSIQFMYRGFTYFNSNVESKNENLLNEC